MKRVLTDPQGDFSSENDLHYTIHLPQPSPVIRDNLGDSGEWHLQWRATPLRKDAQSMHRICLQPLTNWTHHPLCWQITSGFINSWMNASWVTSAYTFLIWIGGWHWPFWFSEVRKINPGILVIIQYFRNYNQQFVLYVGFTWNFNCILALEWALSLEPLILYSEECSKSY